MRRVALGVLAVGAGLLLATFSPLFERFLGRKRLRFPYLARPIPAAQYAKLASKPGWQKAELEVATGIELRGLLRRPKSAAAPWILFYPGNDESQLERGQRFLNLLAGELDWGLAVFPYRGYDASDGKAELAGIRADAPEILSKFCAAERIQAMRVHLVGFSIGGHFAVHAAGGAAQRGQRARTLTLLAPAADIVMYTPSPWEKFSPGEDYQTVPFLGLVPEPVLVVQGSADSAFNGPQQGKAIAAGLGRRARYVEIEGADHVPLLANDLALEATRAFIQNNAD